MAVLAALLSAFVPMWGNAVARAEPPKSQPSGDARHAVSSKNARYPAAPGPACSSRRYYLTKATVDGAHAITACAAGYHMASIWEIREPAALQYNTALGRTQADSGSGPPIPDIAPATSVGGWVRTGNVANTSGGVGESNCAAWTAAGASQSGNVASLSTNWNTVWLANSVGCNQLHSVWCVQD
jgi:hypothetical protein